MKVTAIITAAGSGSRMESETKKQYLNLGGRPVLLYTLDRFQNHQGIDEIILVVPADEIEYKKELVLGKTSKYIKIKKIIPGGANRQESVYNGLLAAYDADIVLIHDGVRPFVTTLQIQRIIFAAQKTGAAILAIPATDTLKETGSDGFIKKSLPRDNIFYAQTPQGFDYELILSAHEAAAGEGFLGTDDASLLERTGRAVSIVPGSSSNIKLTAPSDLILAEAILELLKKKAKKVSAPLNEESKAAAPAETVFLHSDGSCLGNPGNGGYAAIIIDGDSKTELSAGYKMTTNNRMELLGAIEGLNAVLGSSREVVLYTDSSYVVNGFNKGWVYGWEKKNWFEKPGVPRKNSDLWKRLLFLTRKHRVEFRWVKGHAGDKFNERCDILAKQAASGGRLLEDKGFSC